MIRRDVHAGSKVDIKVWHKSQTKKKGKKPRLVATACHSLGELVKRHEIAPSASCDFLFRLTRITSDSSMIGLCQKSRYDSTPNYRRNEEVPAEGNHRTARSSLSRSFHQTQSAAQSQTT